MLSQKQHGYINKSAMLFNLNIDYATDMAMV